VLPRAVCHEGRLVLHASAVLLPDGGVAAIAAYTSMRLWSDSADWLRAGEQQGRLQASPMAHYTNKMVLSPDSRQSAEEPSPVPLRALYLLEPPGPLRIAEAGGMAAIMSLVEAQFTLDVEDRDSVRRSFAAVQRIAGRVPVFHLGYPRDYALLPGVVGAVVNGKTATHAATAGGG
jgi:hypothetical protein